jgi:glycosyltransferase involved in cell wall biosynthesis
MIRQVAVISTIFNDDYLLNDFITKFELAFIELGISDWEFVFVDDGSSEDSVKNSRIIIQKFKKAKLVELNRNFGQHVALAAALDFVSKERVIRCNLDMQDAIDNLSEFFCLSEAGHELVIGKYTKREVPHILAMTSKIFYFSLGWLTGIKYFDNTASLRVFGPNYIKSVKLISERNRLPQALDAWLGFEPKFVDVHHYPREVGKSSYGPKKRFHLALDALFHFSSRPLYLLFYLGMFTSFISVILILILQVLSIMTTFIPGYLTLVCLGVLVLGFQTFMLGLIGLYIASIFEEVKNRPLYVTKNSIPNSTVSERGHHGP